MIMKNKKHKLSMPIYRESGYQKRIKPVSRHEHLMWAAACTIQLFLVVVIFLARHDSGWVEQYYSRGFYRIWAGAVSFLTGKLPFSLAEFIIVTFAVGSIAALIVFIILMVKGGGNRGAIAIRFFMRILSFGTAVLLMFTMGGGLNYYRESFTVYSWLTVRPSEASELSALCGELVKDANALRGQLAEDEAGTATLAPNGMRELSAKANAGYSKLTQQHPQWKPLFALSERVPAKAVHFSEMMSYMQIVGFFFPYTIEANVNVHTSDFNIPNSICHELAHISGFMREDEANFISYLACRSSDDALFRYSGTMLALIHSTNALYTVNSVSYNEVMSMLTPEVMRDIAADSAYYKKYDTMFGKFANNVNDTYLKVNNQQDGVAGYGRMVDLLLADFRNRHDIP